MTVAEFHLEHFEMYREDRKRWKGGGGGVMFYIHESLISIPSFGAGAG